ncbi:hypothetical protein Csp1_15670 [Corynebacterium provencense]|uniref:HTH cro/C1-type domain-containing protein n=1 Tax=Corynebacterium provencense TaxID=1737425 RepID=A0A2Z3YNZ0_9CORY|nr:helix-turn-helix transcriptional regulator [Corynebacterium provencense]AWT26352.1 hypothetical protein Csp1_15670 [Corynebacterium provencense]
MSRSTVGHDVSDDRPSHSTSRERRRHELGVFLRSRRDSASPADYGLTASRRRRAPGLRREEVADLAGLSLTWYTWLEQGRNISVSRQILESLARVFRLSTVERNYLLSLGREAVDNLPLTRPADVTPEQTRVLDRVRDSPAYLTNRRFDVLRSNAEFDMLFPTIAARRQHDRNLLWSAFTDAEVRHRVVNWEQEARVLVAQLRVTAEDSLFSEEFHRFLSELSQRSRKFRQMWQENRILPFESAERAYRDDHIGTFILRYTKLNFAENPDLSLVVQAPVDDISFRQLMESSGPSSHRLRQESH